MNNKSRSAKKKSRSINIWIIGIPEKEKNKIENI